MSKQRKGWFYSAFLVLMLAAAACNCLPETPDQVAATAAAYYAEATRIAASVLTSQANVPNAATINAQGTSIIQTADAAAIPTLTATEPATEEPEPAVESRQWASGATASSQWSDESGAAIEAVGAPDVTECIDQHSAWATVGSNEVATLTLDYETPVIPTQLNIYQTWHPDAVSQVELIDVDGVSHTVYTATPELLPDGSYPCPYILTIDIEGITTPISQVLVTIDQTTFDTWNEIDAVELVGTE